MAKNLVIVESPAKAKTIEKILGKEYKVLSCFGHIRDLPKSKLSIDVQNDFAPKYEISADKKKVISDLSKAAKEADIVWLASDEDREGEAIAWHLEQVLKLNESKTRRIVFNEITKNAILHAIENPRSLDYHLVDAQQARRVLDRLVGYEISPVLWRKVRPQLSAGRVQSVAVKLIVEREEEIKHFQETSSFKVQAKFDLLKENKVSVQAELSTRFADQAKTEEFLMACVASSFSVSDVETKPSKKFPSPPFTTSTLQQEASRKLGFSVTKTMYIAQQLYEMGYITYMRTDSVNLSTTAMGMARDQIQSLYGANYHKSRQYTTKSKGAQEAHEAIRPTAFERMSIEGDAAQKRLYELIWKRTLASQMAEAEVEKTQVTIEISARPEKFIAKGEVLLFDGFLKVYTESKDDDDEITNDENLLPSMSSGDELKASKIFSREVFTQKSPRYSEASLVKKMEELGIGRPSTYAPTISTIQKREYIIKESREASIRTYVFLELKKGKIEYKQLSEKTGYEKDKLFPTDVGSLVHQFLEEHFPSVVDYNFTAEAEKEFDEVAQGLKKWTKMISAFYTPFHKQVEKAADTSDKVKGERLLGAHPETGINIYVKLGRFGPVVQMGETGGESKPSFAALKKGQSMDSLHMEDALELFKLPRTVGEFEGKEMVIGIGRFGPYVRHDGKFISIPKTDDPLEITAQRSIELIESKRESAGKMLIKEFVEEPELQVLNGRYGPYIAFNKKNYKISKTVDAQKLSLEDCREIIKNQEPSSKRRKK